MFLADSPQVKAGHPWRRPGTKPRDLLVNDPPPVVATRVGICDGGGLAAAPALAEEDAGLDAGDEGKGASDPASSSCAALFERNCGSGACADAGVAAVADAEDGGGDGAGDESRQRDLSREDS